MFIDLDVEVVDPELIEVAEDGVGRFRRQVEPVALELGEVLAEPLAPLPSPNSTLSVCAALTTTDTTTSHAAPSEAKVSCATPPSAAKRTSQYFQKNASE